MGKYKWYNLQHIMQQPNTIDDACINISNGNANETNDIARKRNGNTHKKTQNHMHKSTGKVVVNAFVSFILHENEVMQ